MNGNRSAVQWRCFGLGRNAVGSATAKRMLHLADSICTGVDKMKAELKVERLHIDIVLRCVCMARSLLTGERCCSASSVQRSDLPEVNASSALHTSCRCQDAHSSSRMPTVPDENQSVVAQL